ncbi:hypothetical protein Pcinc_014325 [Petrolisthes cinctipes]|uniref:Integrase zinc-binding domain-containing protein n=1 Tax=Petrolisthes cinctipes TaxID=88211 RepID=A0AAE1KRH9_PETCI|nr:hypothetical protein Pcinc_014325 [Petrolisthes cinctipes]
MCFARHAEQDTWMEAEACASGSTPFADALSRIEINAVQLGLDYNQLAKEQQQDPETTAVRTAITALQWKDIPLGDSNISILCDVSTGRPRPWIPSSLRHHVFNLIHGLSHPSHRATTRLLTQKFIWHKISRDAGNWHRVPLLEDHVDMDDHPNAADVQPHAGHGQGQTARRQLVQNVFTRSCCC